MLNEEDFTELLITLERFPNDLDRMHWQNYQEALEVDLVLGYRIRNRYLKFSTKMHLTPLALITMWNEQAADFHSFSLMIQHESGPLRDCVSRCRNGRLQSATCSDTPLDIKNCFELTTLKCESQGNMEDPGSVGSGTGADLFVMNLRRRYEHLIA